MPSKTLERPRYLETMPVRGFELSLRSSGYRPDTIERATRIARFYLSSVNGADPGSRDAVEAFLAAASQRVKRTTLLNYHKDLTMFFRWAQSKGLCGENPLSQIPKPRPSLYERERDTEFLPYTDAEFARLLGVCTVWNWMGKRDRAILRVLWDTPFRAGELLALTEGDINWEGLEISVRDGKAGVRYEALISPVCGEALHEYLIARPAGDGLFLDHHGGPFSRHGLLQLLRKLAARAGWEKPCSPHLFRHNFRARMRVVGMDDAAISALMGHATVVVTHGYARATVRRTAKEQRRRMLV